MKASSLLLLVCVLFGCRNGDSNGNTSELPNVAYQQFRHSTPDEALQALQSLVGVAKAKGTPLRFEDVASILSPYEDASSRVVDMTVSGGIARSHFKLSNGSLIHIRLSAAHKRSSRDWIIFEISEERGDKLLTIYDTTENKEN
jgi:hypothetical protein